MLSELFTNPLTSSKPPCDPDAYVLVRFASGEWADPCLKASEWTWGKYEGDTTITHYRVVLEDQSNG